MCPLSLWWITCHLEQGEEWGMKVVGISRDNLGGVGGAELGNSGYSSLGDLVSNFLLKFSQSFIKANGAY